MIFENNNRTDLYLTGDIGFDVSARKFIEELKTVTTPFLVVHIDSLGGSTLDSISIYNALKDFDGTKTAIIDGVAMSAASYILMAFDKIIAKENSLIMLHNPLVEHCAGNANDLTKVVDTLNSLTEIYVDAYAKRTGKTTEEIKAILDAETYFTANEALELNLIDEIETTSNATILAKDILTQAVQTRLVACKNKHFMNTEEILKKPEEQQEVVETPAEEVVEQVYTVEEANAVLETAKEVNTNEAYKLAYEQITKAIEAIEDKTAFEDILTQLENLIKETEPVSEEIEQPEDEQEKQVEETEPEQQEQADEDKERRQAIVSFAEEINQDGTLDKLLIEALVGDMTLEDFKTKSCKLLSAVSKAKQSFKALLHATNNTTVAKPILRRKSDYIAYYNTLNAEGKTEEAKTFKAKYKNIF